MNWPTQEFALGRNASERIPLFFSISAFSRMRGRRKTIFPSIFFYLIWYYILLPLRFSSLSLEIMTFHYLRSTLNCEIRRYYTNYFSRVIKNANEFKHGKEISLKLEYHYIFSLYTKCNYSSALKYFLNT